MPTAEELVKMGPEYAVALGWTKGTKSEPTRPTYTRITDKGHALMGEAMRANALEHKEETDDRSVMEDTAG